MFQVIYADDHMIDGFECDSFEQAKAEALDILYTWQESAIADMQDTENPSQEDIDNYDYIINEGCAYVEKDGEEYWYPSVEDLRAVHWMPWEDLKKNNLV